MSVRAEVVDFSFSPYDAVIFFGVPETPGLVYERLIDADLVAVCSPRLLRPGPRDAADLAQHRLMELGVRNAWRELFRLAGHPELGHQPATYFEYFSPGIQSAIAGEGLAAGAGLHGDGGHRRRAAWPWPARMWCAPASRTTCRSRCANAACRPSWRFAPG